MPTALTVKLFAQYQACRYASVAAISVWVYDYFLTVADELELLWSRNGILVKSLYLMGRYLPIVGVSIFAGGLFPTWQPDRSNSVSHRNAFGYILVCRVTFTIVILCIMIQNIISLVIFTMRICTVYPMHPNIRRFLQLSLFITLSCFFTCYGVALHHMIPGMVWVPMARVCVIPNYHTWALAAIYILPIFMESLIFFSTLVHAIGYHRQLAYLGNTSTRNVLKRLYIDGTHYYGVGVP
ncbi:hypothetical protein FRB91_002148 [Serendipita sp. 411]|nr:hypothetical protein FRB91_002148 [Serendipita sp. 411]